MSYVANELKLDDKTETTYEVKDLIGKKVVKKKTYYLVWYKGYKKSESTYELETDLRDDGLGDLIDEYNKKQKK